jgi:NAD-dependent DNA ligase
MINWKEQPASNRQKKVLSFFKVPFPANISKGAAARHITDIFGETTNRERWNKYVFLTDDVGGDDSKLKEFDPQRLDGEVLPIDWHAKLERKLKNAFEKQAKSILADGALFEVPEPRVIFADKWFCFTGKFQFGSRKACQTAVEQLGGISDADVSARTNYLVVGKLGSDRFAKEGYGRKMEWAAILRSECGLPLIISEDHWIGSLSASPKR